MQIFIKVQNGIRHYSSEQVAHEHNKFQTLRRSIRQAEEEMEEAIDKAADNQVWRLGTKDELEIREMVISEKSHKEELLRKTHEIE